MDIIRKKRQYFHVQIRRQYHQSFKQNLRKIHFFQKIQQKRILQSLDQLFNQFKKSDDQIKNYWNQQHVNIRDKLNSYQIINQICLKTKSLIQQNQHDDQVISQISYYLLEYLPFLVPPKQSQLEQFPKSFIELSIYILKNQRFGYDQKQQFVGKMNQQTINQCLLNYFYDNLQEITINQCIDIMTIFFMQITKYKNIFLMKLYNNCKYGFLLSQLISQIYRLTEKQRLIYERLQNSFNSIHNHHHNNVSIQLNLFNQYLQKKIRTDQQQHFFIIKLTLFLSNLLLLSPSKNYDIKEKEKQLKWILTYIYRTYLLNEQYNAYHRIIEYCISVLIIQTVTIYDNKYIQILQKVLYQRINQEKIELETKIQIDLDNVNLSSQNKIICGNQNEQEKALGVNSNFQILLNRVKLLALQHLSQQLNNLKIQNIQKWIAYQFKSSADKVLFNLDNAELISSFLKILQNILLNQNSQTYQSYDINSKCYQNKKYDKILQTKMKIFNLIESKGFKQMINHKNLKSYAKQLGKLLQILIKKINSNLSYSSSQRYTNTFYNQNLNCFSSSEQDQYQKSIQTKYFSFPQFKRNIYFCTKQFLDKSYKFINFKIKQMIIINLIVQIDKSFEQFANQYLTQEQQIRFQLNLVKTLEVQSDSSQTYKNSQNSQCSNDKQDEFSSFSNGQPINEKQYHNYKNTYYDHTRQQNCIEI